MSEFVIIFWGTTWRDLPNALSTSGERSFWTKGHTRTGGQTQDTSTGTPDTRYFKHYLFLVLP